jgi:hypothetical protein
MNTDLWVALCAGWVLGLCTGRILRFTVLTFSRRKGGAAMLRRKFQNTRRWVDRNFVAVALIILALAAGMTVISILHSNQVKTESTREIAKVAVCTKKYLAADAKARDSRVEAVQPRDKANDEFVDAEAEFNKSLVAIRGGNATPAQVKAVFDALDRLTKVTATYRAAAEELAHVRTVDYPTYTCDRRQ